MSKWGKFRTILFLIFSGVIIVGLFSYSVWGDRIPIEEIRSYVEASQKAPIIFMSLYAFLSMVTPTTPLMAIAGVLFGFTEGTLYSLVAGMVSASIIFIVSRLLGRLFIENILEKESLEKFNGYYDRVSKRGLTAVVILRITPIMPFNILSLLMGITKISFSDYMLGTLIGLIPSHLVTVYFGSLVLTEAFREFSLYLSIAMFLVVMFWVMWKKPVN